jgi:hypothetical protein
VVDSPAAALVVVVSSVLPLQALATSANTAIISHHRWLFLGNFITPLSFFNPRLSRGGHSVYEEVFRFISRLSEDGHSTATDVGTGSEHRRAGLGTPGIG